MLTYDRYSVQQWGSHLSTFAFLNGQWGSELSQILQQRAQEPKYDPVLWLPSLKHDYFSLSALFFPHTVLGGVTLTLLCHPHFLSTRFTSTFILTLPLLFSLCFCESYQAVLLPPSASTRLKLAVLFNRLNFTSPLKDWPHTKLLFKAKKYTRWGWRGVAGRLCAYTQQAHAQGSPRRAWQYRKWSTPPQGW